MGDGGDFLLFVAAVVGLIGFGIVLLASTTRPTSASEAVVVAAVAAVVGIAVFVASGMTDEAVVVRGKTTYCVQPLGEGPLPAEVLDRCAAQRADRRRQAILSAIGGAMAAAAAVCFVTAVGPLAERRRQTPPEGAIP